MKKLILIISTAAILMGCQTAPQLVSALNNPGGDVTLTFERQRSVDLAARDAQVLLDGLEVCAIPNGDKCQLNTTAGKHTLKVNIPYTAGMFSHAYLFESGKTYQFKIFPKNATADYVSAGLWAFVPGDLIIGAAAGRQANSAKDSELKKDSGDIDDGMLTMSLINN
ncbi:hypothetical protein ICU98_08705 [Polynucleobacter sp. MWH-P3-07-1]|uniref:hypothetical protein n=1 Tax=Polynucleobacter sp. MWH-P3-07-1 TaxID=1743173 RepID=UPI001BFD705E|nr:hypothetical protein [Polynucleobacter sp. MWH-P3-07-1]QWD83487.1 hypothetical protein ICU98_08705 [Polynucleobacter sp. MWH-P3-07-1]